MENDVSQNKVALHPSPPPTTDKRVSTSKSGSESDLVGANTNQQRRSPPLQEEVVAMTGGPEVVGFFKEFTVPLHNKKELYKKKVYSSFQSQNSILSPVIATTSNSGGEQPAADQRDSNKSQKEEKTPPFGEPIRSISRTQEVLAGPEQSHGLEEKIKNNVNTVLEDINLHTSSDLQEPTPPSPPLQKVEANTFGHRLRRTPEVVGRTETPSATPLDVGGDGSPPPPKVMVTTSKSGRGVESAPIFTCFEDQKQAKVSVNRANSYSQAQTLPFLPTFVCKYHIRDMLIDYLNSYPLKQDIPLPFYCGKERWRPLRDVHKFMTEQPFRVLEKSSKNELKVIRRDKNEIFQVSDLKDAQVNLQKDFHARAYYKHTHFENINDVHKLPGPSDFKDIKIEVRNKGENEKPRSIERKVNEDHVFIKTEVIQSNKRLLYKGVSNLPRLYVIHSTASKKLSTNSGPLQKVEAEQTELRCSPKAIGELGEKLLDPKTFSYVGLTPTPKPEQSSSWSPPTTDKRVSTSSLSGSESDLVEARVEQPSDSQSINNLNSFHTNLSEAKKKGKGIEFENLPSIELTAIREILSYTGGGALQHLLKRYHTHSFATFLWSDLQDARIGYQDMIKAVGPRPHRGERKILKRFCRRISRTARRFKIAQLFLRNQRRPEWMILSALPVLPPDLRPILQMSETLVVASDLNNLYQRVIYRNNRYYKLRFIDFNLVTAIQRLVQDAVDRLIENGKGGSKPFYTPGGRPLKSLSDTLKGKKGRFRLNLLGKRVDFSGRSVIVVAPHLKINECGLPREMALELFHYFLVRQFMLKKPGSTIVMAKMAIKQRSPGMWDMLRDLIYHHPVLLNRAPTLHRLGIQAFQPKLVLGNAILLHPLVCSGFNADFDGDQMGVHLPLGFQARAEAWDLLWSRNNLLSPATGQPMLVPSQDMVLGFYYMTTLPTYKTSNLKQFQTFYSTLKSNPVSSARRRISQLPPFPDPSDHSISKSGDKQAHMRLGVGDGAPPPPKGVMQAAPYNKLESYKNNGRESRDLQRITPDLTGSETRVSPVELYNASVQGDNQIKKRMLFQDYHDVITAFHSGRIRLHTPIWLKCGGGLENAGGLETPLEIQVNSFGGVTQIYAKHSCEINLATLSTTMFARTSVGRVMVNYVIFSDVSPL